MLWYRIKHQVETCVFYDNKTVSYRNKNNTVQMAPSELAEGPTSGSQSEPFVLNPVPDAIAENRKSEESSLSAS